jgi:hypothetical protein
MVTEKPGIPLMSRAPRALTAHDADQKPANIDRPCNIGRQGKP